MKSHLGRREMLARLLGTAVAIAAMGLAYTALGWPAPAGAVGLGFVVYLLTRGKRSPDP